MSIIVTQMHRAEHGELEARVSLGNGAIPVTREYGSWMVKGDSGLYRDIASLDVKKRLQETARAFTRRESTDG